MLWLIWNLNNLDLQDISFSYKAKYQYKDSEVIKLCTPGLHGNHAYRSDSWVFPPVCLKGSLSFLNKHSDLH